MTTVPSFDLEDRVVMVTCPVGGIGSQIAQACAEVGASVVLTDRVTPHLAEVAAGIESAGRVEVLPFDLLSVAAIIFLLSDASDSITGHVPAVDGGRLAM